MRVVMMILAALLELAATDRAWAQPAAAQAEVLFNEGRAQMDGGKVAEACALFASSQKLAPAVTTLLNLANCREKNGQLATAWGLFVEAERQTRSNTDAATAKYHAIALERVQRLEPRISKLTISVPTDMRVDRLEILRDGEPVDEPIWNRSLPVDGGTYVISARAPGLAEWSTSITVAVEGDTKTVDIPKLQGLAPVPDQKPKPTTPAAAEQPNGSSPPSKVVPIAVGGGAAAALGIAIGLELSARSTYAKSAPAVEPDPAKQDDYWQSANRKRYLAQGFAIAGIAGAGVAVWLHLRTNKTDVSTQTSVRVEPVVGPDVIGISLVGVSR